MEIAFYTTMSLRPPRIIQSGSERVLATVDSGGGNGGGCWEDYWWFDRSGPAPLRFGDLQSAISSRLPRNVTFDVSCAQLDLESEQVHSWVRLAGARCRACGLVGQVTAKFRLYGFTAVPLEIKYRPPDSQGR